MILQDRIFCFEGILLNTISLRASASRLVSDQSHPRPRSEYPSAPAALAAPCILKAAKVSE